jgi:hypothetical protein
MTLISEDNECSIIWHERLRHLNFHSLKLMMTQNMVVGLPKVLPPFGVCKGFVLGKNHQESFDFGNAWHALNPLELFHNYLFCINKTWLQSVRYIWTFIDDISHYTWVYFLKNKSHVFEIFKDFRALVEKNCGWLIKCLRSDNGGEYVSQWFEDYLLRSGIC